MKISKLAREVGLNHIADLFESLDGPKVSDGEQQLLVEAEAEVEAFEPVSHASAAVPAAWLEGPNPGTPLLGLGHPTSPDEAAKYSQDGAAGVAGETVGATDCRSGGGADRPTSVLLKEAAFHFEEDVIDMESRGYVMTLNRQFINELLDRAAQFEAIED